MPTLRAQRAGGQMSGAWRSVQARLKAVARASSVEMLEDTVDHTDVRAALASWAAQGLLDQWLGSLYRIGEHNGYHRAANRERQGCAQDLPGPGRPIPQALKGERVRAWIRARPLGEEFTSAQMADALGIDRNVGATRASQAYQEGLLVRREVGSKRWYQRKVDA